MYKTNSIQLASYLCTVPTIKFVGVNKDNPHKVIFMFEPDDDSELLASDYFSGKVQVNPLELFEKYRTLKELLFEVKQIEIGDNSEGGIHA